MAAGIVQLVATFWMNIGPDGRIDIFFALGSLPRLGRLVALALGAYFAVAATTGIFSGPQSKAPMVTDDHGNYRVVRNGERFPSTESDLHAATNQAVHVASGVAGLAFVLGFSLTWTREGNAGATGPSS